MYQECFDTFVFCATASLLEVGLIMPNINFPSAASEYASGSISYS